MNKFFLLCIGLLTCYFHKFYLSVTQIQHYQNTLQVISHVFWDDLEIELSAYFSKKIFITDPNIHFYTKKYFQEHFLLYDKGKKLNFEWVGMEITVDKAEIYLEFPNVYSTKNLSLQNHLMFLKFPEQKNMTHLITSDNHRFTILHRVGDGIKSWN
jgi:hypothetical protein